MWPKVSLTNFTFCVVSFYIIASLDLLPLHYFTSQSIIAIVQLLSSFLLSFLFPPFQHHIESWLYKISTLHLCLFLSLYISCSWISDSPNFAILYFLLCLLLLCWLTHLIGRLFTPLYLSLIIFLLIYPTLIVLNILLVTTILYTCISSLKLLDPWPRSLSNNPHPSAPHGPATVSIHALLLILHVAELVLYILSLGHIVM